MRRPGVQLLSSAHFVTVAVALGTLATTLPTGAYSVQARGLLAVAVWWAVVAGVLLRLFPRAPVPAEALVAGGSLVALTGFTALSMGWGVDDGGAFDDTLRAVAYAGVFALVVVASPARSARSWLAGLGIGLVALTVVALASRMAPSLLPGPGPERGAGRDAREAELPARLLERARSAARAHRRAAGGARRAQRGP